MAEPLLRLLISCPDRPGIVAGVSRFLYEVGANIVRSDQYSTDPGGGTFFLRMEFAVAHDKRDGLGEQFGLKVAEPLGMTWRLWDTARRKRIAVLVSRYDHCLLDLLWRWRRGELEGNIVLVASNHPDLRQDVELFEVPYHHVPVDPEHKGSEWVGFRSIRATVASCSASPPKPGNSSAISASAIRSADDTVPELQQTGWEERRLAASVIIRR